MQSLLSTGEALIGQVPLPILGVWGRLAYILGWVLMVCAFGGITFRVGSAWLIGREKQHWDSQSFLALPLTFVLVISTGYLGSFIPLVHGAQTFESLKDLTVYLCIVLFGYPALLTVPFAYGISDLIEGVPPAFLLDWLPGYFINPAFFWLFFLSIGKDPDFRKARTWLAYLATVVVFMTFQPVMWGYLCAGKFTAPLSFGQITPALLMTMTITWILAPPATLIALPVAKRYHLFWAEIQGHVREISWTGGRKEWVSGPRTSDAGEGKTDGGVPLRMLLLAPLVLLTLTMVGATAVVTLRGGELDAIRLAEQLNSTYANNTVEALKAQGLSRQGIDADVLMKLLESQPAEGLGKLFVLDKDFDFVLKASAFKNPAVLKARQVVGAGEVGSGTFTMQVLTASPLSLETWHGYVVSFEVGQQQMYAISLLPESYCLYNSRAGSSQAASVFALTLMLSLVAIVWLGSALTKPLTEISTAASELAVGDLSQRAGSSRVRELKALSNAFNAMAHQMENSIDSLVEEVEQRKVAEAELRVHREQLEKVVEQRTHALSVALDKAESASRAKGAFLAHMSHEIRTPLNAVLVYTQLLKTDSTLTDPQRVHLDAIHSSGEHLLELLNNILQMSRMEAQREQLTTAPFYLTELCEKVLEMFYPMAELNGLCLVFSKSCQVDCRIESDPGKIRQILVNLVSNALKFTPQGEIRLLLSCSSLDDGRLKIVIEVSDDGCGIEPENQERIFQPFDQLEDGAAKAGSGLGLAISRGFARLLDGDLTVESEPGQGAIFRLTFVAVPVGAIEGSQVDPAVHISTENYTSEGEKGNTEEPSEAVDYTATLRSLPPDVQSEVSEAAVQARLNRLLSLANKVDSEFPEAAQQLRDMCTTFQFQALHDAFDNGGSDS